MSGTPPNTFEVHRSNEVADNITARDFSDIIREWFGVEGILDMRAYLRFRCLDYFKNQLLPDEFRYVSEATVSEEEIAINTMIIDFALKHKYYFTLCLLISEIQAFSKFDENVKPLLAHISSMTTDDMDGLTPLLDKEQVSRVLHAFNIDPISENGLTIHRAYQRNENRQSLIQLVLSQHKAANSKFLQKNAETGDHLGNTTDVRRNDFDAIFESLTQQVTEVTRKVTNIEYKFSRSGLGMKHRRRTKTTKVDKKRLDMKFSYITKEVDDTKNKLHILKEVVDQIRLQGKQALRHLSPYIDHLLTTMGQIGRIENVFGKSAFFDPSGNKAIQIRLDALENEVVIQRLAFIKLHFESLHTLIKRLESQGMKLQDAVSAVEEFQKKTSEWPGEIGEALKMKLAAVLEKNPGWTAAVNLAKIHNGEICTPPVGFSPNDIAASNYLPIVSVDVERSFSALKDLLSDKRRYLTPEHLEQHIIVQFNEVD